MQVIFRGYAEWQILMSNADLEVPKQRNVEN